MIEASTDKHILSPGGSITNPIEFVETPFFCGKYPSFWLVMSHLHIACCMVEPTHQVVVKFVSWFHSMFDHRMCFELIFPAQITTVFWFLFQSLNALRSEKILHFKDYPVVMTHVANWKITMLKR